MELKWLQDFVSLASTGNFSRSAEDRHVSQSAFSRRIQSLEAWLGAELVDRGTHPVSLTEPGMRFLGTARYMIQLANSIQEDFQDGESTVAETIAFTSSTNLATSFLPAWVADLSGDFGRFRTTVQTDISGVHKHFEILRSKQSDFLLHYGQGVDVLAMDARRYEHLVVGRDTLVPVCHASLRTDDEYLFPTRSSEPLNYLSPWRNSSIASAIATKITESRSFTRLNTVLESSILGCTKGFVVAAAGFAWLPRSIVVAELECGELVRAADAGFDIPLSIQLHRYSASPSPIAGRFWQFVSERYADLQQ
ncbi:MAG: LysR family transcriptional regulator [Proteobacteria bacterium]|nr:LysR family transcriptional regulator [Pseudomonadota bacterium]